MSGKPQDLDELSALDEVQDEFELSDDPLRKFNSKFKTVDVDPFQVYQTYRIDKVDLIENTKRRRKNIIDHWIQHMNEYDRHPACPNTPHVLEFINKELSKDIGKDWLDTKLRILSNIFDYWSNHPKMPHGTGEAKGYNPIDAGMEFKKHDIKSKTESYTKSQHPMTIGELAHRVRQIEFILSRSVIVTQLKYGARGGQVGNLQIPELKLNHPEINDLYPELGTHPMVSQHDNDVIYFVPTSERRGGKSQRPIVMPVDDELKRLLISYLRVRPPVNEPWLFLNPSGNKLRTEYITNRMWKPAFHPEYEEDERYEAVTSHYARHRFGTYWKKEQDENVEYIKYMRGDNDEDIDEDDLGALKDYVHTYYSDIKSLYLSKIYKFNI